MECVDYRGWMMYVQDPKIWRKQTQDKDSRKAVIKANKAYKGPQYQRQKKEVEEKKKEMMMMIIIIMVVVVMMIMMKRIETYLEDAILKDGTVWELN